ncbi:peroxiredoxin-like family protein [Salisediminibacterium selenitireducens]|uniref:Alkyl hydroperoxide reductase/ Thiol specific antioxidant/ Mal allergen n=1 Tax=Bacillus selenitireducens (strain ATCC 700615 / DSM 15326 / MLS10) TaxID=439292 RepID=D6Y049_BACIE|nr:peroxiredoxin-like family protein [Salisediminibacterium selenitireducens]ADH98440.1 hypothetical protein Bsel_0917 [[Bacillus] selenitireducens MLS10]
MREAHSDIEETGTKLVVVAPSNRSFIEQFTHLFGPFPYPIYGDPERQIYKHMQLKTMNKVKLLAMAGAAFASGKVKGFMPKKQAQKNFVMKSMKTQDVYIQGGAFLYDGEGKLLWKHIDQSPDDHAKINTIKSKLP